MKLGLTTVPLDYPSTIMPSYSVSLLRHRADIQPEPSHDEGYYVGLFTKVDFLFDGYPGRDLEFTSEF